MEGSPTKCRRAGRWLKTMQPPRTVQSQPVLGRGTKQQRKLTTGANDDGAVLESHAFGTSCLVLAGGVSRTQSGALCGTNQLISFKTYYSVASCNARILIRSPVPGTSPMSMGSVFACACKLIAVCGGGGSVQCLCRRRAIARSK